MIVRKARDDDIARHVQGAAHDHQALDAAAIIGIARQPLGDVGQGPGGQQRYRLPPRGERIVQQVDRVALIGARLLGRDVTPDRRSMSSCQGTGNTK
jgi:hypothetical protein